MTIERDGFVAAQSIFSFKLQQKANNNTRTQSRRKRIIEWKIRAKEAQEGLRWRNTDERDIIALNYDY